MGAFRQVSTFSKLWKHNSIDEWRWSSKETNYNRCSTAPNSTILNNPLIHPFDTAVPLHLHKYKTPYCLWSKIWVSKLKTRLCKQDFIYNNYFTFPVVLYSRCTSHILRLTQLHPEFVPHISEPEYLISWTTPRKVPSRNDEQAVGMV